MSAFFPKIRTARIHHNSFLIGPTIIIKGSILNKISAIITPPINTKTENPSLVNNIKTL